MTSTKRAPLPDPQAMPTLSVDEAAAVLGLGRTHAYAQAKLYIDSGGAEGIPAFRLGHRVRVLTKALLDQLRLSA